MPKDKPQVECTNCAGRGWTHEGGADAQCGACGGTGQVWPVPLFEGEPAEPWRSDEDLVPTVQAVADWWSDTAAGDLDAFLPKLQEYGSNDLIDCGRALALVAGWNGLDDGQCAEIGVFFYLYGKMSRWAEALANRRRPSDDTLHDVTVYSMMARRIRETGALK